MTFPMNDDAGSGNTVVDKKAIGNGFSVNSNQ